LIIEKPWGREEILEKNDKYMVKKITMYEGKRCSLQYHNEKTETIYVLFGQLRIFIGESGEKCFSKIFDPYTSITIPAKIIHRMEAVKNCVYLEASTPEIDDVVRLEDDYKRN
jgi:mannose-6-phosphate isomerase